MSDDVVRFRIEVPDAELAGARALRVLGGRLPGPGGASSASRPPGWS
ncbi:MAG TPA: hypothetical protein VF053_08740 [Streptosporangiales bacterium]